MYAGETKVPVSTKEIFFAKTCSCFPQILSQDNEASRLEQLTFNA